MVKKNTFHSQINRIIYHFAFSLSFKVVVYSNSIRAVLFCIVILTLYFKRKVCLGSSAKFFS